MRRIYLALAIGFIVVGCNTTQKKDAQAIDTEEVAVSYQSFGDEINDEAVLSKDEIWERYKSG